MQSHCVVVHSTFVFAGHYRHGANADVVQARSCDASRFKLDHKQFHGFCLMKWQNVQLEGRCQLLRALIELTASVSN